MQYSVFEVAASGKVFDRLKARMEAVLDCKEDSVRMYPACKSCAAKAVCLGVSAQTPWWEPDVYIV